MPDIKCPKCDRDYRCPRCNGDRLFRSGTLYDKTRYKCSDCSVGSYHCRECDKAAKQAKEDKANAKANKVSRRPKQWGFRGF